ncbi:MAG: PQQ-binding-like beta-propeller repeat protein, partial [Planctomycetaceae bacterium]|nr:PQQ-binding-like beta-propeller repeat protein [Planctomycetaceae bacterium]
TPGATICRPAGAKTLLDIFVKSILQLLIGPAARRYGLRVAVPTLIVLWLGVTVWQATQFEIHPAADRTPFLLADPRPGVNDWPGWRGPSQDGAVASEFLPPPTGSEGWSDVWRCRLDGAAQTGACVWGERVFVTATDTRQAAIELVCLHRLTGAVEWRTPLTIIPVKTSPTKTRPTSSAVPACDGERVFVPVMADGELWMFAIQMNGRVAWKQAVGPARGHGVPRSSPTLSGSLVIVAHDQSGLPMLPGKPCSYLAGLHRQTGAIVYRIARPNGDSDGTPIVAEIAGRPQAVLTGRQGVRSYDPASGREIWHCKWKTARTDGSVAFDAEHVYAASGEADGELLCVGADGEGDVTESHVVWRERRPGQIALSPLITQAGLIVLTRDGLLTAFHQTTGKPLWQKRSLGTCSLAPLRIGTEGVCVISDEGHITMLNADRRGDVLWEANLGRAVLAAPAVSQGRLILRTPDELLTIGGPDHDTLVQQPGASSKPL